MWEGSDTDLLSGKSMFIDMHDIDLPDKSAFSFTVNIHVVSDVAQHHSFISVQLMNISLCTGGN